MYLRCLYDCGDIFFFSTKLYSQEVGIIVEVVDWRTLKIAFDDIVEEVRLLGIDIPEDVHNQKELKINKNIEKLRERAKSHIQSLVENGLPVLVEFDEKKMDSDGRLLAYVCFTKCSCISRVYLDRDGFKCEMLNENMLRNGFAFIRISPPNEKYADTLFQAYLYAQENGVGMWQR